MAPTSGNGAPDQGSVGPAGGAFCSGHGARAPLAERVVLPGSVRRDKSWGAASLRHLRDDPSHETLHRTKEQLFDFIAVF